MVTPITPPNRHTLAGALLSLRDAAITQPNITQVLTRTPTDTEFLIRPLHQRTMLFHLLTTPTTYIYLALTFKPDLPPPQFIATVYPTGYTTTLYEPEITDLYQQLKGIR